MNQTKEGTVCLHITLVIQEDTSERIVLFTMLILNCLTAVLTIFQNSIIIWTVLKNSNLHRPSFVLLVCLAFTDFATALISQTAFVVYSLAKYHRNWEQYCNAVYVIICSSVILSGVSLGTLSLVSIDRYFALHFHLRYNELVTNQRVLILFALLWVAMSMTLVPRFLGEVSTFTVILTIGCTVSILTIFFCYWKIFKITQRHHREIDSIENATRPNQVRPENILKIRKSSVTFLMITLVLIVFMTPYVVFNLCFVIIGYQGFVVLLGDISIAVLLANSAVNPAIYVWRLTELRNAVLRELSSCFKRKS